MRKPLNPFISVCIIVVVSAALIFGLLRFQAIQYLAAFSCCGFAKSLPAINSAIKNAQIDTPTCDSQPIKILTYNVRYGSDILERLRKPFGQYAADSYLPWSERYPEIKNRIAGYQPDLIGLQEMHTNNDIAHIVPPEQYTLLSYHLKNFEYGDSALLFKSTRFEMLDSGQIWLSPDTDLPLSLGFKQFAMIRYANWAMLREKATGFTFVFVNTHFDNNPENKEKSADLFHDRFVNLATTHPLIVVGDFNSKATTERYHRLLGSSDSQPFLINAYDLDTSPKTELNSNPNELIDHILTGGPCKIAAHDWQVDKTPLTTGQPLSDHDPVMAVLQFSHN
jgi:endonuclease/exonuclease/phosphatase family metal-dependent hydrolase